jgi:D-aspartate ligase
MTRPSGKGKCPAVVLGLSPTGLVAVRSLGRMGVPVFGVADTRWPVGRASRYCRFLRDLSTVSSRGDADGLCEGLVRLAEGLGERPVLYVTDDRHIELLGSHFETLAEHFRLSTDYRISGLAVLDKRSFYELCERHGLDYPATRWPRTPDEVERLGRELRFPALLKPALAHHFYHSIGPKKVVVVNSTSELVDAYRKYSRVPGDLLIQEVIPGSDDRIWISIVYTDRHSEPKAVFVGRKLRQFPPHYGSASLAESVANADVEAISLRFLRALGFRGIASLEFKEDSRDGRLRMIEVNPRLDLASSLCGRAGVDIVRAAYFDLVGETAPTVDQVDGVRWVFLLQDLRSALRMSRAGEISLSEWMRSLGGVRSEAVFAGDDPGPAIVLPLHSALRRFRRRVA